MSPLEPICSLHDLKECSQQELLDLAHTIRQFLLKIGDQCGGHLASNLGVVELTLALHCVLNSPTDKIVWDVSHQCYVHKLLTGRLNDMLTLRQYGGLSGFAKITESDHDIFGAGHAGTALSAALGVAHARDIKKESYSVFSVIGDATLSNGMVFEALNNIGSLDSNFVCVLNDNNMSISKPTGSIAQYMTRLRTSRVYDLMRLKCERIFSKMPKISAPLTRRIEKALDHIRDLVLDVKFGVIFEEFGFKYLGPLDGHNLPVLIAAFKYAKTYPGPIMIHIVTKKGKGHPQAEADPFSYHGVSPLKPTTQPSIVKAKTFSQMLGDTLMTIAKKNPRLMVVTPAMKIGSGLVEYANAFPHQFIDVGIAEGHAMTYCAGLARNGATPVLAIYSTFLQRSYDQLIHDVCLQNLPVIFAIDRAGLVGEDGPTHHGVFDYAFMLHIPNLMILAPKDGAELQDMLMWAVHHNQHPIAIRYPKAAPLPLTQPITPMRRAKAEILFETSGPFHAVLIAAGTLAIPAYTVATQLSQAGYRVALINLRFIKPLDTPTLTQYINRADTVFVLEEGTCIGGIYSYLLHQLPDCKKSLDTFHSIAIPDRFVDHGSIQELHQEVGLSSDQIYRTVQDQLEKKVETPTPINHPTTA